MPLSRGQRGAHAGLTAAAVVWGKQRSGGVGAVLGVAVADDRRSVPRADLDGVIRVALDGLDGAVVVVLHDHADVVDRVDRLAAAPGEEDDGAGLGDLAPAALVLEP